MTGHFCKRLGPTFAGFDGLPNCRHPIFRVDLMIELGWLGIALLHDTLPNTHNRELYFLLRLPKMAFFGSSGTTSATGMFSPTVEASFGVS